MWLTRGQWDHMDALTPGWTLGYFRAEVALVPPCTLTFPSPLIWRIIFLFLFLALALALCLCLVRQKQATTHPYAIPEGCHHLPPQGPEDPENDPEGAG